MATQYNEQFPKGIITPLNTLAKGYPVITLFRRYLGEMNMAFVEDCCPLVNEGITTLRSTDDGTEIQYYDRAARTWLPASGAGGSPPNTIYSADDALVSDRIIDLAGFDLSFVNGALSSYDATQHIFRGNLSLNDYGGGAITGSPAYMLAVDSSGNVVEAVISGSAYTSNNGITLTGTNFKLGGSLTANTTITGGTNILILDSTSTNTGFIVNNIAGGVSTAIGATATGSGAGMVANVDSGIAIKGISATGTALYGVASGSQTTLVAQNLSSGLGIWSTTITGLPLLAQINSPTTNAVASMMRIDRLTSGTAADGIGSSIDFTTQGNSSLFTANQIISKLTDATLGTSEFSIRGVNAGTVTYPLFISGDGKIQFYHYGTHTFTGTSAYAPEFDNNGRIIEVPLLSLTTTGSGVATYSGSTRVLNIPTPGGGGGNTIYSANDSLVSNRTLNLGGHTLDIIDSLGTSIDLDPVNATAYINGRDPSNARAQLNLVGQDGVSNFFELSAYNSSDLGVVITGDIITNTITYTADTHAFIGRTIGLVNPADNFANDGAAATGLVPIGALYHNAGVVRIRLV